MAYLVHHPHTPPAELANHLVFMGNHRGHGRFCRFELGFVGLFSRVLVTENDDGAVVSSTPGVGQIDQRITGLLEGRPLPD